MPEQPNREREIFEAALDLTSAEARNAYLREQCADAELRAHRESMLRARYAYGHIDQMPRNKPLDFTDIDRVQREYFAGGSAFEGQLRRGPARPDPPSRKR